MKRFLLVVSLLLLQSCAGLVQQMHSDFDRADGRGHVEPNPQGNFDLYRGQQNFQTNRRPHTAALTAPTTSADRTQMMPAVRRQYESIANVPTRVRADDLRDNGASGSLWTQNDGKSTHLFTNNRKIQNGDIVIINVYNKLKNEITLELKRAFPEPLAKAKPEAKDGEAQPNAAAPAADAVGTAQAAPARGGDESFDEGVTGTNRVYDRISTVAIENIDEQHILLRGRKDVLYKNRKRLVEIQSIVPIRDINDNNTVNSDSILEQTITVLR